MWFRTRTAMAISVFRRPSVRNRKPSPRTCFQRLKTASTSARTQRADIVPGGFLPRHPSLLANGPQVPITLGRVGLGLRTRHRRGAGRHDHHGAWRVLRHGCGHAGLVVRPVGHERGKRLLDLIQQRTDLRTVIDAAVGQGGRHHPPGDRIHSDMQRLSGTAALGSVPFDQPFARPAQLDARAVDQQVHGSARQRATASGVNQIVRLPRARSPATGRLDATRPLALAVALDGMPGVHALAADTDGIDGTEDNAGALLAPDTLKRAAALGIDAKARLADNDGYGFFQALGDLVVTGPTLTNVNDFRAILIDGREPPSKGKG